jgi:DNA uptake protein ComE-like DNA-binding protein
MKSSRAIPAQTLPCQLAPEVRKWRVGKMARAMALGIAFFFVAVHCGAQQDRDYSATGSPSRVPPESRVDINHATIEELLKVPGMTRVWALRIMRFRPYRTKQDLLDEGVVSGEVYRRTRDHLIAHKDKEQL